MQDVDTALASEAPHTSQFSASKTTAAGSSRRNIIRHRINLVKAVDLKSDMFSNVYYDGVKNFTSDHSS